jgi:hypothetical protein
MKRALGKPRCRWEDIKIDLKCTGCEVVTGFIWLRIGSVVGCF